MDRKERTPVVKQRRRKWIIFLSILLVLIAVVSLFGFSFVFPKSIRLLDLLRMPVQTRIMSAISHYRVDDLFPTEEIGLEGIEGLDMVELNAYLNMLQPGDIFFTDSDKYLSSNMIPGKWKHSGIFLGNRKQLEAWPWMPAALKAAAEKMYITGEEWLILDSTEPGVTIREFEDLSNLRSGSLLIAFSAVRINKPPHIIGRFLSFATGQIGKPYDFDFITDDTEELYCSELLYEALKDIGIILEIRERMFGREVISPNATVDYILQYGIPRKEFLKIFSIEKNDGELTQDH